MKDEKWLKDELRAFARSCKENAKEDLRQANECRVSEPKRSEFLAGSANAMEHAAKEIRRILAGKTTLEAMAETMRKGALKLRGREAAR